MTSRSLFFKLMKEDMKRKLWAIGLAFLVFFFEMPVAAAMGISELLRSYERWIEYGISLGDGITPEMELAERMRGLVETILGLDNMLMVFTMITAALVLALTGFMYMHSKKQMDFYHSIPVRRELIFAVKYLDSIFIVMVMYLFNMFLAFGIFAANGISLSLMFDAGFVTFFVHMAGFLLCYGLMTIAVMLTGNFFVSILGGIALFSYVPAFGALLTGLMYMFFVTVNFRVFSLNQAMVHGSPIPYYIFLAVDGSGLDMEKYGSLMGRVGIAFAVAVVMAVIALVLYRFRPSESAGKAMAFNVSKAPIKILIVTPVTICMSILFWNIYYSLPWAVFGFVFGLFITHGIIEIIYHFEFRKLFANPLHIGICAALSLAVIGIFRYDVIGYDRYLPSENELQSASVYSAGLKDWSNYGLPVKREGETAYEWNYMNASDYAAGNMEITDYAIIRELAEAGIEYAKRGKEAQVSGGSFPAEEESSEYWTTMEVGYHLKNGKKVFRNYNVSLTSMREIFDRLYEEEEYKEGIYPLLSYEMDNITGIYESRDNRIQKVEADEALSQEILDAYKEEMTALTLAERAECTPITSLRFLTVAENNYLHEITVSRSPNFGGDFNLSDMNQVNFFPVYPSFTKTLALLGQAGIEIEMTVPVGDVERIEIQSEYFDYYGEEDYGEAYWGIDTEDGNSYAVQVSGEKVITIQNDGSKETEDMIEEILGSSELQSMAALNGLQPRELGFSIFVYRKSVNEGKDPAEEEFSHYTFRAGEVPVFIQEAVGYDRIESQHVSYGLNGQN